MKELTEKERERMDRWGKKEGRGGNEGGRRVDETAKSVLASEEFVTDGCQEYPRDNSFKQGILKKKQ